jgi:hypothetical protein
MNEVIQKAILDRLYQKAKIEILWEDLANEIEKRDIKKPKQQDFPKDTVEDAIEKAVRELRSGASVRLEYN